MSYATKTLVIAALLGILLAGCGQKGPLYLSGQQPKTNQLPATGPSKPQRQDGSTTSPKNPTPTLPAPTANTPTPSK